MRLVILVALTSCHGNAAGSRPQLTAALVPPAFKGIVVGSSKLDDVKRAFPDVEVGTMSFNGAPAVSIQGHGIAAEVVDGVVVQVETGGNDLCSFVEKSFDALPHSHDCSPGVKTGKLGGSWVYCAAVGERIVDVRCNTTDHLGDQLSYSLGKPR